MEGLTASDVALMQKDTNDWGGGSFMWIFALLILLFVGGGGDIKTYRYSTYV